MVQLHRSCSRPPIVLLCCAVLLARCTTTRAGSPGSSELFLYGEGLGTQAHAGGTSWTYDSAGDDWRSGADAAGQPWVCASGQQQSPINLPGPSNSSSSSSSSSSSLTMMPVPEEQRVLFDLGTAASNGSNVRLTNTGHGVQLSWRDALRDGSFKPRITVAVQEGQPLVSATAVRAGDTKGVVRVVAVPQQLHFHAHSEHLVDGHLFPLEAHLVSTVSQASLPACPPSGCVLVTGVMFELDGGNLDTPNAWLEPLFQAMPLSEGEAVPLPAGASLDLQALLPASDSSYISYAGSLTTPPCSEGVLWVMMAATQKMSLAQLRRFMQAVGDYNCSSDAAAANSSTANATRVPGRRFLQQQAAAAGQQHLVCSKLGAGANYRLPQPLNGRALRVWTQPRGAGRKGGSSYLPEDAASAASAGAVAGIVLGTTLGAGLTALIGWAAYREYNRRRVKRFYKYGVSSTDMLSLAREVEATPWLSAAGDGGSGPPRPL